MNLSGRWTGYYTQHDHERPMSAEFDQHGSHLHGSMHDEVTAFRMSVSEMVMEEGLPPGTDEKIVASIREAVPDAPEGPVEAEWQLWPLSTVEGEVEGRAVHFRKTYRGPFFAGYRIGEVRLGFLGNDQEVEFRGRISPDGSVIEGRWLLSDLPRPLWADHLEGEFVLRRDAEPSSN